MTKLEVKRMDRNELEKNALMRVFQLSNLWQSVINQTLVDSNVTTKQFLMMILIGSFGRNPKLGELSERFKSSHQNTKQVLLKLEKNGFVKLYKDEHDSRVLRCALTEEANSFWMNRNDKDELIISELFEVLETEELRNFLEVIVKLFEKAENKK